MRTRRAMGPAPFVEREAQRLHRISHVGVPRAERGVVLVQEVAAMLHDVVERQVHEPDVGGLVGLQQVRAQVVDGGELPIVVLLGEVASIEQRPAVVGMRRIAVLGMQARLVEADEELGVHLGHFVREEPLQQVDPLAPAIVAASLSAMHPGLGGGLRRREHAAPPSGLAFEAAEIAVVVEHRPANRPRADVQPHLIRFDVAQIHRFPFPDVPARTGNILIPVKMSLQVKIKAKPYLPFGAPRRRHFDLLRGPSGPCFFFYNQPSPSRTNHVRKRIFS